LRVYRDYCANDVSNEGGYDVLGMQLGRKIEEMRIEFWWGSLWNKSTWKREEKS
jgi:hypothetical protein